MKKIKKKIANWIETNDHRLHLWSGFGHLAKGATSLFVFVVGSYYLISNHFLAYKSLFDSHFWVFVGSIIWFVITATLFYAVLSSRSYKALLDRLGATCAENMTEEDYTYSERRKIIKKYSDDFHDSKKLFILGATGFHTFAKPGDQREDSDNSALLRPVLEKLSNDKSRCNAVEINILLLHPDSKYAALRVETLDPKQTLQEYQKEILDSIYACREFKRELPKLKCYVYDRPLIWKLILTDAFVWQQFYKEGTHAENSRINIFSNVPESGNALYHPFLKLFELLRDSAFEIDLNNEELSIPEHT